MTRHINKGRGIAAVLASLALSLALSACASSNGTTKPTTPRLETPAAEEIAVATSPDVPTAAEVYAGAQERGFGDIVVMSAYDMESKLHDDAEIPSDSTEKHPLYYFVYTSVDDYQWCVYNCNGSYSATPMYVYEFDNGLEVYVEDDFYTSFNSASGKFYKASLSDTEVNAIKVDRIDSKTLDKLTVEMTSATPDAS